MLYKEVTVFVTMMAQQPKPNFFFLDDEMSSFVVVKAVFMMWMTEFDWQTRSTYTLWLIQYRSPMIMRFARSFV